MVRGNIEHTITLRKPETREIDRQIDRQTDRQIDVVGARSRMFTNGTG